MIGGFLPSLRLRCQSAILSNPPGAGTSCFQGKVNVLSSGARGQCAQRARSTGLHTSCCASFCVRHSRTLRLRRECIVLTHLRTFTYQECAGRKKTDVLIHITCFKKMKSETPDLWFATYLTLSKSRSSFLWVENLTDLTYNPGIDGWINKDDEQIHQQTCC